MEEADTRKMIPVLGMMTSGAMGTIMRHPRSVSPGLKAEPAGAPNTLEVNQG